MPALAAVLEALERKQGEPLTRSQVEEAVAATPSIVMEHRDAQALERSRGYADIDPERAWEQWQVLRAAR